MTTLPLTVPYTFGNTTTQNQLTYLDTDFTTIFNAVNGIGNGSVTLSTPVITGALTLSTPLTAANGGTGVSNASLTPITATGSTTARTLGDRFGDVENVKDFGAVGNGVADDYAAFNAAYTAATAGSVIDIPFGKYYFSLSVSGSKKVLWSSNGATNGDGSLPIADYNLPGVTETFWQGSKMFKKSVSEATDYAVTRFDYNMTHSGGSAVVNSNIVGNLTVSGSPNSYGWCTNFTLNSTATGSGQHAALHGTANRTAIPSGGSGIMSPLFAAGIEAADQTNQPSSIAGSLVGLELDVYGGGADDFNAEGIRTGLDLIFGKYSSTNTTFGVGTMLRIRRSAADGSTDTTSTMKRGIEVRDTYTVAAIDLSLAVPSGTYASAGGSLLGAIVIEAGQRLAYSGDGSVWSAFDGTTWFLANGSSPIITATAGTGAVSVTGAFTIGGNVGFYGHASAAKPTVTGSRGANAALASLLTALSGLGLITDSSS